MEAPYAGFGDKRLFEISLGELGENSKLHRVFQLFSYNTIAFCLSAELFWGLLLFLKQQSAVGAEQNLRGPVRVCMCHGR